jgi:hypothetical protein
MHVADRLFLVERLAHPPHLLPSSDDHLQCEAEESEQTGGEDAGAVVLRNVDSDCGA